eukprot:scaffold301982_cov19-Prasinocladus_malaysianus.AAC.1
MTTVFKFHIISSNVMSAQLQLKAESQVRHCLILQLECKRGYMNALRLDITQYSTEISEGIKPTR